MSDDVIIRIEGLHKRYGLPLLPTLRRYWHALRGGLNSQSEIYNPDDDGLWALRDINLEVRRGEMLGIIGRNGVGKSTLLKLLAGVTPCTHGRVEVRGSIFPMIELNAGIHPELTGQENIYLLGAIMGLSRQAIGAMIPGIEEFSELGEWINKPVRMYSSGMLARLGFSVAMNVKAEILLIDEVLSVGDLAFQRKCFDRIEELRSSEVTILFVSHNIRQVQRICPRVILMEGGKIVRRGSATEISNAYYSDSVQEHSHHVQRTLSEQGVGIDEILIDSVKIYNEKDEVANAIVSGKPLKVEIAFNVREQIENVYVSLNVRTSDFIFLACLKAQGISLPVGKSALTWRMPVMHLLPGAYILSTTVKEANNRDIMRDEANRVLTVLPNRLGTNVDGLVNLPAEWQLTANGRSGKENQLIAAGRWDTSL